VCVCVCVCVSECVCVSVCVCVCAVFLNILQHFLMNKGKVLRQSNTNGRR